MTETVKRIVELMELRGDNAHTLEVNAKLPVSSLYSWKKDKFKPSTDSIISIARYFNVSADYLLCLTDEPKPLESREIEQAILSVPTIVNEMPNLFKEQRFINTAKIYNELPDEYRERAFGLIMGIAVGLGINIEYVLRR